MWKVDLAVAYLGIVPQDETIWDVKKKWKYLVILWRVEGVIRIKMEHELVSCKTRISRSTSPN